MYSELQGLNENIYESNRRNEINEPEKKDMRQTYSEREI